MYADAIFVITSPKAMSIDASESKAATFGFSPTVKT